MSTTVKIVVTFFAVSRDLAGCDTDTFEFDSPAGVYGVVWFVCADV